jgi:hypothetical protein
MADIAADAIVTTGNFAKWIACSRKRPFSNRKLAKDAASRIRARGGTKLRPYKCEHCGSFHLATEQTNRAGKT